MIFVSFYSTSHHIYHNLSFKYTFIHVMVHLLLLSEAQVAPVFYELSR
jgi:hypothetical protein